MLQAHRFQHELVGTIHRLLLAQQIVVEFDELQKILETTGNYLALLPSLDEARIKHEWYSHSVESMGGS